jgi:hypothetical protein
MFRKCRKRQRMREILLIVFLAWPVAALAQPGGLSEEVTKVYQDGYYEYDLFRITNPADPRITEGVVRTENRLRAKVIGAWYDENIEERLRWVRQQNWTADYKAMFERAVEWRRKAFDGGAEKLYRLSRKYRHVPNAEEYGYTNLSQYLLTLAGFAGHEQALKDLGEDPKANFYILDWNRGRNYRDAVKGRRYAMSSLATAYLMGPIFDDDRTKGYYWYLRRSKLTPRKSLKNILRDKLSLVSPAERERAESWINSGHIPSLY